MIDRLAIEGFRSIRSLVLDLDPLTVITGRNGTGKSNVYRAMRLLAAVGRGRVVPELAHDGGLDSVRWAGPETIARAVREGGPTQGLMRSGPVALRLGFGLASGLGYAIDLGLPVPLSGEGIISLFDRDPHIKQEHVFAGLDPRPTSVLVERKGPHVRTRSGSTWTALDMRVDPWQSVIDEFSGIEAAPELGGIRRTLERWRFHDTFRTDRDAPARAPQVITRSPRLDDDGANLAAALRTTMEFGDERAVRDAIADAFDGASLQLVGEDGRLSVALQQRGMLRPMTAPELSDGTLQFLLLLAALTSVEQPSLIVLNEPERSLHADVIRPLARLITRASATTQVVVISHYADLVSALGDDPIVLEKDIGQTVVAGREGLLDQPSWHWPKR